MSKLSKCIISLLVPQNIKEDGSLNIEFELSNKGLLRMLQKWDNSEASEINKQQFLYANEILQRQHATNSFKETLTNWRSRGVDQWHESNTLKHNCHSCQIDYNAKQVKECKDHNELSKIEAREISTFIDALISKEYSSEKSCSIDAKEKLYIAVVR